MNLTDDSPRFFGSEDVFQVVATQRFFFKSLFGEDEPILTSIFFKGVGSTTNQFWVTFCPPK